MCTSGDPDYCPDAPEEPSPITPAPTAETEQPANLRRRTFLKAAALGTAAAALFNKGVSLGPLSVYAHDMSSQQCTANDVRIVGGLGQIINEPCGCDGTFTATVQFTVENNAASERGCVMLHLAGGPFAVPDILLYTAGGGNTIPGKTTQTMFGDIANYPCGSGLVCFGLAGEEIRGRCDAPCSTVSWTVPGQDACPPDRFISSKCRHQQICIQGRGDVTLDCDISVDGIQESCAVTCGGSATLRLCTSSPAAFGPFTYTLSDGQSFGPTSETCHDFEVGPITADTTFTGTVTDNTGCSDSDDTTLTVNAIATPLISRNNPDCEGDVDYAVDNCDGSLSYTWHEADCATGAAFGDSLGTGCTLTKRWAFGSTHCVVVTASNGEEACEQTSAPLSVTIPGEFLLELGPFVQADCTGAGTFTASATGGVEPYTFTWRVDGANQAETGPVFSWTPILDGLCHEVQCKVTDSRGCEGNGARTRTISQCVETDDAAGSCPE